MIQHKNEYIIIFIIFLSNHVTRYTYTTICKLGQQTSNILNLIFDMTTIWKMNESMKTANSPFWRRLEEGNLGERLDILQLSQTFHDRYNTILFNVTLHHNHTTINAPLSHPLTNERPKYLERLMKVKWPRATIHRPSPFNQR